MDDALRRTLYSNVAQTTPVAGSSKRGFQIECHTLSLDSDGFAEDHSTCLARKELAVAPKRLF